MQFFSIFRSVWLDFKNNKPFKTYRSFNVWNGHRFETLKGILPITKLNGVQALKKTTCKISLKYIQRLWTLSCQKHKRTETQIVYCRTLHKFNTISLTRPTQLYLLPIQCIITTDSHNVGDLIQGSDKVSRVLVGRITYPEETPCGDVGGGCKGLRREAS